MTTTVVIVGTDAADTARSLDSVRAQEALADATVVVRPDDDRAPWSEVADGAVVFLRAGDRLLAAGPLLDGLLDADVALGGHRIAGRGHWGLDVAAPALADVGQLAGWAAAPPFELSTIAVRRNVLPTALQPAPGLPGGEVALLHAALTTSRRSAAPVDAIVAEVRIRPEHSGDAAAQLRRLHGVLTGPLGREPVTASVVRRRALSLAYLEAAQPIVGQFDADTWWGPTLTGPDAAAALALVRDLQWALTCLAETHRFRLEGLDGLALHAITDMTAATTPDQSTLTTTVESLHLHVAELTDTIRWLHAEIRHRDDQIARDAAVPPPTPAPTPAPMPRVDELRTAELGRMFLARVAGAVRHRLTRSDS